MASAKLTCEFLIQLKTPPSALIILCDSTSDVIALDDSPVLRFSATPMPWADTFETMTVEFGSSKSTLDYILRHHQDLSKRQATPTASSTPTISYPFSQISPSATTAFDLNLNHHLINHRLARFEATLPQSRNSSVS